MVHPETLRKSRLKQSKHHKKLPVQVINVSIEKTMSRKNIYIARISGYSGNRGVTVFASLIDDRIDLNTIKHHLLCKDDSKRTHIVVTININKPMILIPEVKEVELGPHMQPTVKLIALKIHPKLKLLRIDGAIKNPMILLIGIYGNVICLHGRRIKILNSSIEKSYINRLIYWTTYECCSKLPKNSRYHIYNESNTLLLDSEYQDIDTIYVKGTDSTMSKVIISCALLSKMTLQAKNVLIMISSDMEKQVIIVPYGIHHSWKIITV